VKENLLSSILDFECGRHASAGGRRTSTSVDTVDFLQAASCTVICEESEPCNGTESLIALADWRTFGCWDGSILAAWCEAQVLVIGAEIEVWCGVVGEVVLSADDEIGCCEVWLVLRCEVEL